KADKETVKSLREEVHKFHDQVRKTPLPPVVHKTGHIDIPEPQGGTIAVGDYVIINDTMTIGQVVERKGEDIVVSFNSVHFRTTVGKVTKTKQKPPQAGSRRSSAESMAIYSEMNRKATEFNLELDIRGMRAQEAIDELEHYIDDALLLQIHEVRIIHGKGDGILRKVVREFLAKNSDVRSFRDEAMERGGYGATVVEM
ncbi:MAG: Smr/MutS family protein, partial [Bacteroidales bacterium]|nr:Smr/MutS family protein [Bacteroidales bacterium]